MNIIVTGGAGFIGIMIILKIWLFIKIAYRGFAVFHMKKWC